VSDLALAGRQQPFCLLLQ